MSFFIFWQDWNIMINIHITLQITFRSVTSTATLYNMLRTVHFYRRNLFRSLTCFITTLMRRAVKEYYSLLKTMTVNLNACFQQSPLGRSSNSKCVTSSSLGSSQVCLLRQEVGRGGRDDRSAYTIWFANGMVNTITNEKMITITKSSVQRKMCTWG